MSSSPDDNRKDQVEKEPGCCTWCALHQLESAAQTPAPGSGEAEGNPGPQRTKDTFKPRCDPDFHEQLVRARESLKGLEAEGVIKPFVVRYPTIIWDEPKLASENGISGNKGSGQASQPSTSLGADPESMSNIGLGETSSEDASV